MPARFARPEASSEEGGLWAMMDREESRLRRSPFVLRDPELRQYVQDIACRLAGDHCPDISVHLIRTPFFNASMAPNGMMQVWSGLMLRLDNEAQLAAVLGHEIGHYLARHQLDRLRDLKSRSAVSQFLGLFGLVGAIGQLGVAASMFAYGRDHERHADLIGMKLMGAAGYETAQAAKVWENLQLELSARPDGAKESIFFATHPPATERQEALLQLASEAPGGTTRAQQWQEKIRPHLRDWLRDEIKRGQHEESIALLSRKIAAGADRAEYLYARGEVLRLRGRPEDLDAALADYTAAIQAGDEPPETHRGLGLIYRLRTRTADARASFGRYLELAPQAPDSAMIKSYMEELPL